MRQHYVKKIKCAKQGRKFQDCADMRVLEKQEKKVIWSLRHKTFSFKE